MRDATVLTLATMAAAFVVYAVLMDSEEEEDEEPRIKRPDRGWLKRRQERGVFEGIFKELRAEDPSVHIQEMSQRHFLAS